VIHSSTGLAENTVAKDKMMNQDDAALTLDRRLPLAMVGAVLIQTFGALIWAGSTSARIAQVESQAARVQELAERAARVEEQTSLMRASLARIETKLDEAGKTNRGP